MNNRQASERKHEIRVGLTILVALGILAFIILSVGEHQGILQDRYTLRVLMSRVNGLQTGAPVRLAGVDVGSVVKVDFPEKITDQKIEVVLEIAKKVQPRIREDSEAHIGTLGLLGDKFVGITMGSLEKPMLKDNALLQSADPIDVEKLLDAGVDVFDVISKTTSTIHEISTKINQGKGTLGLLVNDPRMYLDIEKLLLLTESLTRKIDQGEGTLARLFQDSTLYDNLNALLETTTVLADSVRTGQGTMGKLIRDPLLFDRLAESIERTNGLLIKIDQGDGTLSRALNDKMLYQDASRAVAELDSLIKDLRRNPQRYLKVELF
jgi:phospholipid/cholesterol/gamma-HCH transport system substrate-binding protein